MLSWRFCQDGGSGDGLSRPGIGPNSGVGDRVGGRDGGGVDGSGRLGSVGGDLGVGIGTEWRGTVGTGGDGEGRLNSLAIPKDSPPSYDEAIKQGGGDGDGCKLDGVNECPVYYSHVPTQ